MPGGPRNRRHRIRGPFVVAVLVSCFAAPPASAAQTVAGPSIPQIHGSTFRSPYAGDRVRDVTGVVTSVTEAGSARGFTFADPGAPHRRASSGLFVFTGTHTPDVRVGNAVSVSGTVRDHFPDGPAEDSLDLPVTELTDATTRVRAEHRPVPKPLVLDERNVPPRLSAGAGGGSIEHHTLQPRRYALDFYKAHESELVTVRDAHVVGPTNEHGELWITARPHDNPTPRGGTRYGSYARPNPGRLLVTPSPGHRLPRSDVGDTLRGPTTGPLGYSQFGGYQVQATNVGTRSPGGTRPERTRAQRRAELAIATYNVENLSPRDDPSKFDRLARGVADNLAAPDIVSLEEIQDNDGPTDDGVTGADVTLEKLTDAIVAAGGPRYEWREIDPRDGADGGQPGGNIRNAFLFDPDRVSFADRPGGDATTPTEVRGAHGAPRLSASPGRIEPGATAWRDSRKPLAGEFTFHGHKVFVIGNHFNSKGGDQPLEGRNQPPARSTEHQRLAQAKLVHRFVRRIESRDPSANVVVLGDMNDYEFSPALHALTAGGALTDLVETLPAPQRYSYVYQGNSQVLDHILTSPSIRGGYDIVHTNGEFADQVSDHDPQVLRAHPVR